MESNVYRVPAQGKDADGGVINTRELLGDYGVTFTEREDGWLDATFPPLDWDLEEDEEGFDAYHDELNIEVTYPSETSAEGSLIAYLD